MVAEAQDPGIEVHERAGAGAFEALERSRDHLEMAIEAAHMGIWEFDFRTRQVRRSLRHDQLFGYGELQPSWSRSVARAHFLPEDRPAFDAAFERAVREGRLMLEGRVRWPDGSVHWLRTVGRMYYDEAGAPVRMTGVVTEVTERKEAAAALSASEARMRLLADAMPQLVWTARADGSIDYLNARAEEYEGFVQGGDEWYFEGVLHPEDRFRTMEAWGAAVQRHGPYEIEHRLRLRDGGYRWHLSRAIPYFEGGKAPIRWYGTSTDIHDRKEAEIELEGARDRLRVALEAAEMGTWETNFIDGSSHRSLRHDQIFGYAELQPEWSLERARQQVIPEDLPAFERAVAEAERTGTLRHEVRIRRPDGAVRWIYSLGRYYRDAAGNRTRRAGVIMDVTEQKEAEQALRLLNESLEQQVAARTRELQQARDHFAALFHTGPVAAALLSLPEGRILEVNAELERFFGYAEAEVVGRTLGRIGVLVDRQLALVKRVRRGEPIRDEEVRVRRRDGRRRVALLSVQPIERAGEQSAIVTLVDITQRKAAEEAVRRLSSALTLAEQRERQRVSQVLHDDLQQILFGIEMRLSMLGLALGSGSPPDPPAEDQLESLAVLVEAAIRATRTLAIELHPPVLRGEGLGAALAWLAHHMREMHGLSVAVTYDEGADVPSAEQRILVVHVVRELLFNVVKHAHVRRAALSVRALGDHLEICVEDEGVGFEVERLRQDAQFRSLGLFGIEERLRLFGGSVEIRAAPGHGTRVRIRIPMMHLGEATPVTDAAGQGE